MADGVMNLLTKASRDLSHVQRQLHREYQATYPHHVNPCNLVARIKKIQDEMVSLKELCKDLLKEKQDLVDQATSLAGQRSSLQRLLVSLGLPPMDDSDDMVYTSLNQVINEWADQVRVTTGNDEENDEDINQMLFSAIVQSN